MSLKKCANNERTLLRHSAKIWNAFAMKYTSIGCCPMIQKESLEKGEKNAPTRNNLIRVIQGNFHTVC